MTRTVSALTCFLLLAPAVTVSLAQPPQPVRLTLEEALSRGVEASHRLAEYRAREAAGRATLRLRDAADQPQLGVLAGYTRTNHVDAFGIRQPSGAFLEIYPDIPDTFRTRLDLQWPVYTSGRVQASTRAAASEVEATVNESAAVRGDVRLEITRAWWNLVTATESARVLESALVRTEAHLADVRNRRKVGLIPESDVLSVQAQRSRQQVLLIEARNSRDLAASDLARLVGLPPGTPVEFEARLDEAPPVAGKVDALVAEARRARPERKALERRIAGASERVAAARAASRPAVSVGGGVDFARPNPRIFPRTAEFHESWDASVNVSWSLWDGGRAKAEAAEATATREALEARLREFDSILEVEIRQRLLDLEAAAAAIRAAGDAVASASEARRMIADRYAAGIATNIEVLDAEVALLQAELDRTRAMAGAHMAAARLERALGR
ncbi:MAG: TolC family protein [Vicinamibacterales bacterium]